MSETTSRLLRTVVSVRRTLTILDFRSESVSLLRISNSSLIRSGDRKDLRVPSSLSYKPMWFFFN